MLDILLLRAPDASYFTDCIFANWGPGMSLKYRQFLRSLFSDRAHPRCDRLRRTRRCQSIPGRDGSATSAETLEQRALLAAAIDTSWQRMDPAGSLIFEQDYRGDLSQTVNLYSNDFESGGLGSEWSTSSSTQNGRVEVSNILGTPAQSGSYHLAMDTSVIGPLNLNEATLTLNLAGQSDVDFSFWHKDVNDEDTPLPQSFTGSVFGDGVSISEDGTTWYTLTSFNNANSPNGVYTEFTFDLDQAAADAGIAFDADFHIKFQQYDNFPFNTDGRAFDDVLVQSTVSSPDTTTVFVEGNQTLTVVASPDDSDTTLTASLFDSGNTLLASASASAAGEPVVLQTIALPSDDDYRIVVDGDISTEFNMTLVRNASVEVFDTDDGDEQDVTDSLIALGSGRWGVVGTLGGSGGPVLQAGPIYTTHNDGRSLGTISKASGAGSDIGPFGFGQTWAAAFDTDGTLYTLVNGFSGNARLATVNQATGQATPIGNGTGVSMISLEIAADGTAYGIGYSDRQLYRIDKTTGLATSIGNTGIPTSMDLAFDSTGTLYATSSNRIWTVNPATGASTLLGTYTGVVSGSVMGIMFDLDDTLYATAYVSNSPLYDIDLNSLSATVVGSTGFLRPHGGDIYIASSLPFSPGGTVLDSPAPDPDVYGDPGEPGRFPPGPNAPTQPASPGELLVNGSFETGNFTGWTTVTTGRPFRPWAVTGAAQGGGFGMLQTQPQDGTFVAWNGFDGTGPMQFQLYQDVTIPADTSATLSWMDRVQWNFTLGGAATIPRTYDVEVRDPVTNSVLASLFSFSTGTQAVNPTGNTGWQTHSVDVSAFAGQTVRIYFEEDIPQASTGPAQIEFDAISLVSSLGDVQEVMYAGVGRGSGVNPGGVLLVDQTTGAGTLLADPITPGGLTGLDFDGSGRLWGSKIDGPLGNRVSDLVQINPDDGSLISSIGITYNGIPISIGDLAVQPGTDLIYGVHSNSDATSFPGGLIFTISPATGVATLVGNPNQNRNGGLGFTDDGRLFYLEFNQLHELNPANATILSTTNLNFGGHDGLGIRPSDGVFFASRNGAGTLGDEIRIIDPVAGTSTLIGQTGAGNASDLAFREIRVNQSDTDEYTLDLTQLSGSQIDIVMSLQDGADADGVTIELLDIDGTTVLATGATVADNYDRGILDFVVPGPGTYTVRVTGFTGRYAIAVTDDLVFDSESNDSPSGPVLRSLDPVHGAMGFLGGGSSGDVDLSLIQSFESLSFPTDSGFIPPDPIIAAGPESVVTMVNTDIAIHDKSTGTRITSADLDGAGGFWATSNIVFDPWVTFDPHSERFIALAVDRVSSGGGSSRIYLAVSTDSTPNNLTTDWNKYIINRTGTHLVTSGSTFADYPKLGVNDDAIFVTANEFGILGGGFSHVSLFAIDKAPLLTGGPANIVYDEVITSAFSVHPVVQYDSGSDMMFAEAVGTTGIRLHTVSDILTAPVRTTSTVTVPTFLFPQDVPQQGGSPLDSVSQRIMSGVVRDNSLWTAHAIQDPAVDTETVVRWYEFDVSSPTPALIQSGNVDPGPNLHTWMASVNVDNDGDMGIVFSISGPAQFAGIGYTGRLASDPLGTTRPIEIARNGEGSYSRFDGIGRNRWGDYSGLAIDPDGETFWLYHEYAATGNNWGTFVGSFQVEGTSGANDRDVYSITLTAGDTIGIQTSTPFDSAVDGVNLLDPAIVVLDPNGATVAMDSDSLDGKNAFLALTPALSGVYTITVGQDAGSEPGEYTLTTFNINDAPTIDGVALDTDSINEDESVTLTVQFSDPDPGDSHTIVVTWGDGDVTTLPVGGPGSYALTHQYLDDGPSPGNGTPADVYAISVTVIDAAGESDSATDSTTDVIVNGGFETGDLTGWSLSTTNSANWQINDGTLDPPGPGLPTAPISGSFDVVSTQSGSGVALLSESFVVPSGLTSAVLSWSDRIQNFANRFDDPLQEWRVLVLDNSGNLIQEVFSTAPGDPLTQMGPNPRSFDLTSLFQSLAGQEIAVSFEQQSQFFFMNVSLDDVSLSISSNLEVTVNNVAPDIDSVSLDTTVIDEDESVTVTGSFIDPGTLDVHTVTVDWGDGTTENVTLATGARTFSLTHQYLDDGPSPGNGTSSDVYEVQISVSDDDSGTDDAGQISDVIRNGSFETGDFTDWTTVTTGAPFRPWAVSGAGAGNGFGFDPTSPQDGSFVAWNGFDGGGPMEFQLFQDVTIPSGATAQLDWMDRIQWNFQLGGTATLPRLYDVEVRDPNTNAILTTLHSFSTGTQSENPTGDTTWLTHTADLSAFAGQTVRIFFNETIPQRATGPAQFEVDAIRLNVMEPLTVTVNNVAPKNVAVSVDSASIDEAGTVTLTGSFDDPGTLDVHTVTINWGDGSSDTLTLATGERSFSVSHVFDDDGPSPGNGTPFDDYTLTVTVADDDLGAGGDSVAVRVNNVAPQITQFADPAPPSDKGQEGEPIQLDLAFSDPGTLDVLTARVDWGDGSTDNVTLPLGQRSLNLDHVYSSGGIFTVTVTLTDDDTGSATLTTTAFITGVGILEVDGQNVLYVVGTSDDDHVTINQQGNGQLRVHASFIDDAGGRRFNLGDIDRIVNFMCEGDDHVNMAGNLELPTITDAGAGDDHINGGGGSDIILGRDGNDHLNGRGGNDLLIGGSGFDRLVGGKDDDLLFGGIFSAEQDSDGNPLESFLDDEEALLAIQQIWSDNTRSTAARANDIAGIDSFFDSLFDDHTADRLTGSSGADLFLLFDGDSGTDAGKKKSDDIVWIF